MMADRAEGAQGSKSRPWIFLVRLVAVLVVVAAAVVLFKRAIAPERQFQVVLEAEARAMSRGDWKAFEALQDPEDQAFRRYQKSGFDSYLSARQRGEAWATEPATALYVVEVGRRDDRAWALAVTDPGGDPTTGLTAGPARIEFFRRVYGQWLHTGPDPEHWGQPQESSTEHITWGYREADAAQVARLGTVAETFTQQVCDDLGLDLEAGALHVSLCYSLDCGYVVYPHDRELQVPTPLLAGYDQEGLEHLLADQLANTLINRATGFDADSRPAASRILNGIQRWEVAQMTGGARGGDPLYSVREAAAAGTLLPLEGLNPPLGSENTALVHDQAYTLVEYLVVQYGREILPALVRAASQRVGAAETLKEVLGPDLDLAAFEGGWLAFIRERYGP